MKKSYKILRDAGFEITQYKGKEDRKSFSDMVAQFDALIVGAHEFTTEDLARCKNLKIICKYGVGVDNIDLQKAKEMGIAVTNTPGANAKAVSDLAFGMMLDCARNISLGNKSVHDGVWKSVMGVDVCEKTLGVMGFGAIGKNLAKRARGFDMKIFAYDPYLKEIPAGYEYVTLCSKDEMLAQCDFLSLHLPLNEQTYNFIAKRELAAMKKRRLCRQYGKGRDRQ